MPRKSTASTAEGEDAATTAGDVPKGQGKSADVETGANVEVCTLWETLSRTASCPFRSLSLWLAFHLENVFLADRANLVEF
jgi:hypothetical protein